MRDPDIFRDLVLPLFLAQVARYVISCAYNSISSSTNVMVCYSTGIGTPNTARSDTLPLETQKILPEN